MSGSRFAQTLVFGFMANPATTREGLNQTAANTGMQITTPGLDKRMNGKAVYFLDSLLAEALKSVITAQKPTASLLSRFTGVYVGDSTLVALPEALASVFRGCNGERDATVKVAVQWELVAGTLKVWLTDGMVHDQRTALNAAPLPAGAVRLNDLGFFNLHTFADDQANGVYFFSRYKVGTRVYRASGESLDLSQQLPRQRQQAYELNIQLGSQRLPCRLLAFPVPPAQVAQRRRRLRQQARRKQQPVSQRRLTLAGWTLSVTNIPPEQLRLDEAPILGATRWQIECLFDLWKNQGPLDESRS